MPIIEDSAEKSTPVLIATLILEKYDIATMEDNGEIWVFNKKEGIWQRRGERLIRSHCLFIQEESARQRFIEEVLYFVRMQTLQERDAFFNEPSHFIPMKNCIVDIRDMSTELWYTRKRRFNSKFPVNFKPDTPCPEIGKFLNDVCETPQDAVTLLQFIGYCFYRAMPIHRALILLGEGSNGKSTFLEVLRRLLSEKNVCSVALQELQSSRFASAKFYNKYANLYGDLSADALTQSGLFKMLTGGDSISAERKFQEPFTFTNHAKMIFSANRLPMTYDDSDAFFRRIIMINFPTVFEDKDTKLIDKLTTEAELEGLAWQALGNLHALLKKGDFHYAKTTDETRKLYTRRSDSVACFVADRIDQDPEGWITRDDLYKEYIGFCKENKLIVVNQIFFGRRLRFHIPVIDSTTRIDEKQVRIYRGISWRIS